jgi:hypothetical protein
MAESKRHNVIKVALAYGIVGLFLFGNADAQDLDPRRYINLPVNQNFLRVAIGYSEGDVNTSPSLPFTDAQLTMKGTSLAYLRTMNIGGKTSTFDAYLPYMCASGSVLLDGAPQSRDVCGLADARIRFSYNFVGAPALEMNEYVKREKSTVVGASLQVYVPVGDYDDDKLLNIGANRWVIKPEIGVSIPWHKWSFEFTAGARWFADNDKFVGATLLKQDPLYNTQIHVVYDFSPRQWMSLNANYFFGGTSYKDDVPTSPRQENARLGITWAVALNSKNVVKFVAHTGVVTRVGNDADTVSAEWIYRWD